MSLIDYVIFTPLVSLPKITFNNVYTHESEIHIITCSFHTYVIPFAAQGQTNYYWNGGNTAANPAAGGTGTWGTTDAWRTVTATGSTGTWTAAASGTNAAFLEGTGGTITLNPGSANFTGSAMNVNVTAYTVTSTSSNRNLLMTGTLTLANNVTFSIDQNNSGGTWAFGSLSLGSGAVLNFGGVATANNTNRTNLTSASTISSGGSINLNGTAAGSTGFVATAIGVVLNTNILNNSSPFATMLGATSGNSLTYGGVVSGTAHLQISAGNAGGTGTTILSGSNNYSGNTYLNTGTNHVLRIGASDTLPTGTTVIFGASAGGGTADNGGSIDLNGLNLAVGALSKSSNPSQGIGNNTNTTSTLTIGKATGSDTFAGKIGTVTNSNMITQSGKISVVKTGASTQILSGANDYTGTTTIKEGTLALSGSGTLGSGNVTLEGGTLDFTGISASVYTLSNLQTLAGSGDINATGKTLQLDGTLGPGASAGIIEVNGNLTLGEVSISNFEILGLAANQYDQLSTTGTLTLDGTLNLLTTGTYTPGNFVQLFDAGTLSGTFDSITGTDLGGGLSWDTSTIATNGRITVIPEPSAITLLGLSTLALLSRRRRL